MTILKATDGRRWYISIDGESFELCQREPFLNDRLATDVDRVVVNAPVVEPEAEVTLSREELEQRGFIISEVTG